MRERGMWDAAGLLLLALTAASAIESVSFECPKGQWKLHGLNCYQFFSIRHSWQKASELCKRYGSNLVSVASFRQNNFTADLALQQLQSSSHENAYWLGYQTQNGLQTNTLAAATGSQISQYYGHWAQHQPDTSAGQCVQSVLPEDGSRQEWALTRCETLLPFMCEIQACPKGSKHCSNGKCVNQKYVCDDQDDCGDGSDELDCEDRCRYHMNQLNSGQVESPGSSSGRGYPQFADCKWTLEGPQGTNIVLVFSKFETEKVFDTVQILGGGRTEETAVNIATLSGNLETMQTTTFTSASNFMIIKFRSDESVEKSGFHASWSTSADQQSCSSELTAEAAPNEFASPGYGGGSPYAGGLECLTLIRAAKGQIITLEIEEFDMEPRNDFVLIRDGESPTSPQLVTLTGAQRDNPQFVVSTGSSLYIYTRTDQADSRQGYRIKYYVGCDAVFNQANGTLESPAYGVENYPPNQDCTYRVRHPEGGRLSMRFNDLRLHSSDRVKVWDGQGGVELHPKDGFTGQDTPVDTYSAERGELYISFKTSASKNATGFSIVFSADCPVLQPGAGAIMSSTDTTFDAVVGFSCPIGHLFATGVKEMESRCQPGGQWDNDYIPACVEAYCGPVPQIDNGFAVQASNVTWKGVGQFQCYYGFAFPSGNQLESISCLADGSWSPLPNCQATKCPPLPEVDHATPNQLAGKGLNYGTVIRYECDPGYERSGLPTLLCQSNGTWSSLVPTCTRKRCFNFPAIEDGFIENKDKPYYYQDRATVRCNKGFRLIGTDIISCGEEEAFTNLPTCVDIDECANPQCDFSTTQCVNTPGSHYCKCKDGMEPSLTCRPVEDLGLSNYGIPTKGIYVSGVEPGYQKDWVRLDPRNQVGWCGVSSQKGPLVSNNPDMGNWVIIDLLAPTIVRGFRTQGVQRLDNRLAYPTAIRLMYADELADKFQELRNADGSQVEFRVLDGATQSIMNLPNPIEARFIRLNIINFETAPCMKIEINGCSRQSCKDVNECLDKNGGCDQKCANAAGGMSCKCNVGYELYSTNGTSEYFIPDKETGLRDGDLYRLDKSCVRKMCPRLAGPENGMVMTNEEHYRFGDMIKFMCNFGYVMTGNPSLLCTSSGDWNGTIPECNMATCTSIENDPAEGLLVARDNQEELQIPFSRNVSLSCNEVGKPMHRRATAGFRQCVYDPKPGGPDYWLSGAQPECPRVDCGTPPLIPGADYGDFIDTRYQSSFIFGCKEKGAFQLRGKSSRNSNFVTCLDSGVWDFGNLRCEGPVCEDPLRPPDGEQISESYEQGSQVEFTCNKPGYIPINPTPVECVEQPECKVVKPLGITSGRIPDSAINATSERGNYEAKNIRLNAVTGWCGQQEAFTYVAVDLGLVHRVKAILVKGVITDDVVGRPTELRFFYKEQEKDNYVVYFPNFNLTARDPGNYGELAMITLPLPVRARFVILGIVSFDKNPCLKFELMGCEDVPPQERHLGFNNGFPHCVDNEPPAFRNCPAHPIVVQKSPNGVLLPVNFTQPVAVDNSGSIARTDVKPEGFALPLTTFSDMMVEYFAYDYDGNVAICQVNITVPDDTPPFLECPQSFVIELVDEKSEYPVNFKNLRQQVNTSDPSGDVTVTFIPERAVIKTGDYQNVTVYSRDKNDNVATCHFQVSIQPTRCVAWELKPPAHGDINCNPVSGGFECVATCGSGYRFTDGQEQLFYQCQSGTPGTPWSPSRVVPDCVSVDTRESTYDVVATMTYKAQSAEIPEACIQSYLDTVSLSFPDLSQVLTGRCSAGGVSTQVDFKPTVVGDVRGNSIQLLYTMMVAPTISQPRIFDLCGQTHDLLFDLSISGTNPVISPLIKVVSANIQCPTLTAANSEVFRGFACNVGEVLNKIQSSLVPRCLECPAGYTAGRNASSCTLCPRGQYQDEARQGSCKACPSGRWTKDEGSKSVADCVPVCGYGTYSPTGLVPCLECPRNTFTLEPPTDGFKECTKCAEGMFTFQPGTNDPRKCQEKCSPGHYSATGLAPCAPCPKDHFQPLAGQDMCFKCASDEETTSTGSMEKKECRAVTCSDNLCINFGLCVPIQHRPKCYCPAGFTGQYCEIDVDECASRPCFNGAECVDLPQNYRCECPEGFTGLQCQDEISDCDKPDVCPERAMCKDLPGPDNFECLCRNGYKGENCDVTEDPCSEKGNPCSNGAACKTLEQGRYTCQCPAGWTGRHCNENIDDCLEQPCLLGGNCTDLVGDFECSCSNGFTGKRCETKVDLCENDPCVRGMCVDKLFRYECVCEPGWTGEDCDINVEDCASNPCQNKGICLDEVAGYTCVCEPGFTGVNCQHTVDFCVDDPCKNGGTCTSTTDSFECTCRPGFKLPNCVQERDECEQSPCDPTGTMECLDLDNRFECKCRDGYTGETCQTNIDDCKNSPCRNGGECQDLVGDFKCLCPSGWVGKGCEEDEKKCDASKCSNNATCVDMFQDFFCACPSGTDGKRCETSPQRCIGDPCMNGGACRDLGYSLNCSCSKDYTGIGCQWEYDACAKGACKNGATCIDKGRGYKCICPPGYEGENCDVNINDCLTADCPAASTCIDLTNDFYCKCPFNLTGEGCMKNIAIDYDLHFTDDGKSSSASLVVPFRLASQEFSVAMWVQFDSADETGTYFTMYSVEHEYYPLNKRIMVQAQNGGVYVNLNPATDSGIFLQFSGSVPINDGQWHHLALVWSGVNGELTLTADGIRADTKADYNIGATLPEFGYVTLGSTETGDGRLRTESGFHGKLTRVQAWNRALDTDDEIPRQVQSLNLDKGTSKCKDTPILFNGLIMRFAGYEKTVGGVERIMPSICGKRSCAPGYTGPDCTNLQEDKIPPQVRYCPGDIWIATHNGSATVNWDLPEFVDNTKIARMVEPTISSGQALQWGIYDVSYVAYDLADNSAACTFKIYVLESFCPPLDKPEGGDQNCEDWGPGGRFKVCRISCNDNMKFSQPVPEFYTCGAEGFWRPNPNTDPTSPFVYPACSVATPAQKIFKIKLQYLAKVLCSKAGQGVLKDKIINALQELNTNWRFSTCDKITEEECKGLGVSVNCIQKASGGGRTRVKRQELEDQKYDLEISFPTIDGEEVINSAGARANLTRLLEQLLLEQNVNELLPETTLDRASVSLASSYTCQLGRVVRGAECVPCPAGTHYDEETAECNKCPHGTYTTTEAQVACTVCPEQLSGKPGVTQSEGSTSMSDCKEHCTPGHYFDDITGLCRPCGIGKFQPDNGKFTCYMCGVGLTTRIRDAMSREECRPECPNGEELDLVGECQSCAAGTYRRKGVHQGCQSCPQGFTTRGQGAVSHGECSLPICAAGQYLNASINACTECNAGFYQPEQQQTECLPCPPNTSTKRAGAVSSDECTNRCKVAEGEMELCDRNAICLFHPSNNTHQCECKPGYFGSGETGDCTDTCEGRCKNEGVCVKDKYGDAYCQCAGSFTGEDCEAKSEFAYIAGGITGAVIFIILLVLLIWMICVRATRVKKPEKHGLHGPGAESHHGGNGVNFYYGGHQPPYAESIAPSHAPSTYAHYYDDEEDGWDMPNFYSEGHMKQGMVGGEKGHSLGRSQGSLYGNKEELYDRLKRHAYQPGQGKKEKSSANETTSDSDDARH